MFSKLTFITSARCANSSTECGEKQTGVSHLTTQANVGNEKLHQRAFPYRDRLIHTRDFTGAGKLNLNFAVLSVSMRRYGTIRRNETDISVKQSWNQRNPMRRVSARVDMNCVTFVRSLKLACKKHRRGEVNQ